MRRRRLEAFYTESYTQCLYIATPIRNANMLCSICNNGACLNDMTLACHDWSGSITLQDLSLQPCDWLVFLPFSDIVLLLHAIARSTAVYRNDQICHQVLQDFDHLFKHHPHPWLLAALEDRRSLSEEHSARLSDRSAASYPVTGAIILALRGISNELLIWPLQHLMLPSTMSEQPWHAAYPEPRSKPASISRGEVLDLLKSGAGKADLVLVDLRRTDFEVCSMH